MPSPAPDLSRVRLLIFDLDGTLIDSKLDLALSVNAMREQLGAGPLPHETIATYVGHGVEKLVQRSLGEGATQEALSRGLGLFRDHYRQHMLDHTGLYPGVREALEELQGRFMAVLSNKPVNHSREILKGLGVAHYFMSVYGGNSFARKKPDPAGVLALMYQADVAPDEVLMVGDSDTDVLTGRNAGARTCGVTYGFGAPTLKNVSPDWTIGDLRELPILLNSPKAAESTR